MARLAIENLEARGIRATADDVIDLHELAKRVSNESRLVNPFGDYPVCVGNVVLHSFSISARTWLIEEASLWFDGYYDWLAVGYAMSEGRNPGWNDGMHDAASAKKVLMAWRRSILCSYRELVQGIEEMLARNIPMEEKETNDGGVDHTAYMLALLCHHYPGTTPEHWLFVRSEKETVAMLNELTRLLNKEMRGEDDLKFIASANFNKRIREIEERAA